MKCINNTTALHTVQLIIFNSLLTSTITVKMKLIILLSILVIAQAGVLKDHCDGFTINGVYHDREALLDRDLDRPYLLDVDRYNNILYFNYNNGGDFTFKTAILDLSTKEMKTIDDIENGYALTIDQESQNVYVSSDNKIYKYNHKRNEVTLLVDTGKWIWSLYYKNALYFSSNPEQEFFVYKQGHFGKFPDLEHTTALNFVIDRDGVMFYSNRTGLYSQNRGTKDAVLYGTYPLYAIRQLTTDNYGKIYACIEDGIYVVNKETVALEKVLDLDYPFGISFDNENNMIYSDSTRVFRLRKNVNKIC